MIDTYRKNQEKYQKLIKYANNHLDIPKDVKKDIVEVMEKYRICISCMESQQVCDLIEKCSKAKSYIPLKKELHATIFGVIPSRESRDTEKENYLY